MTFYWVMLVMGIYIYLINSGHVLIMLMSLEFMMLVIFGCLVNYVCIMGGGSQFLLVFIIFIVCESAVSLGVLVSIVRSHGNDNFSSLGVLMC